LATLAEINKESKKLKLKGEKNYDNKKNNNQYRKGKTTAKSKN
jgi:hypothetical protein